MYVPRGIWVENINVSCPDYRTRKVRKNDQDWLKMHSFLRTFNGRGTYSLSYARFPVEELDKVLAILVANKCWVTQRIGCYELDGKYCIVKQIDRKSCGFSIRRKNGEPCWNICLLNGNMHPNISFEDLADIFSLLKDGGVSLSLPKEHCEYIPPITKEEADKNRDEIVLLRHPVDKTNVEDAQVEELKWNNER